MQTILVTGANGFVGHHLVQWLLQKEYAVIATAKGPSRLLFTHPKLQYFSLDFTEKDRAEKVIAAYKPNVIVHAGAWTKPDDCEQNKEAAWQVNVQGTQNMLKAATQCGAFFLQVSTDFVFAGNKEVYTEADEPDPVNYYGQTKIEAEEMVRGYGSHWAIVRPILLYGKPMSGKQNLLTMVAHALQEGRSLRLFIDQRRLPTYITDLCWGLEKIIEKKAIGIYHFCGEDVLTPYDIGLKVARHLYLDEDLIQPVTAETFYQPAARPPQTFFDLTKVKNAFGYQPSSFDVGLAKTFATGT